MLFHKLTATVFGIGYIGKGAGTVAAIFCSVCWYMAWAGNYPGHITLIITAIITLVGIWSGYMVEPLWGKDHGRVVIDEVAGMCFSLLFIPVNITTVLAALLFFRFFDIAKPLYIRKMEALPGGLGVMMDDVLAGIYANILLQVLIIILPGQLI